MGRGYFLREGVLIIERDLTELDYFVRDFLDILKQYSDYLVVSGFVSISTGRTRATEDVDILIPVKNKEEFTEFFNELIKKDFWCYQGDFAEEVYGYVENMQNIRFARKGEMFPNIEVVFINESKKAKYYEFTHPLKIKIRDFEFKIPPLEFEILYKEIILAGKKDIEDAKHLRTLFKDILTKNRFKECEKVIRTELNKEKK